jgi:lipoyl(octanoyl) transferase
MAVLTHIPLARRDYAATLALQHQLVAAAQTDPTRAYLLSVEHDPPVITLGRRGQSADVIASPAALAKAGITTERITRGGQTTYHGPGQLVMYPIWALRDSRRSLHGHVHRMQRAVVHICKQLGIEARLDDSAVGVFVEDRKIAAFGVAADRWVCFHGLALNVSTDLSHFDHLIPCGQADGVVTSLAAELNAPVAMQDVLSPLRDALARLNSFTEIDERSEAEVLHDLA